jgi:hypothetical protein
MKLQLKGNYSLKGLILDAGALANRNKKKRYETIRLLASKTGQFLRLCEEYFVAIEAYFLVLSLINISAFNIIIQFKLISTLDTLDESLTIFPATYSIIQFKPICTLSPFVSHYA